MKILPITRQATACARLILTCIVIAVPGALAADDTLSTAPDLRPAYCTGDYDAQEQRIGDTCIEAEAGWENGCSDVVRQKNRSLAQQSKTNARNAIATAAGYADYQQCSNEVFSDAGVAQMQECKKHYTGKELSVCVSSGPATPACKRLLPCENP